MTVDFRLDGRRALVTGAGRGLGRAIADGLAESGAQVIATSRDPGTAAAMGERYGTQPCVLDVRDVRGIRNAVDEVWRSAPLDILVNNAGVNVPQPVLDVDEDSWDTVVDTNLKGTFFVTQAFARLASRDGRPGAVISIGSDAGMVGIEERAAYCASKGGLVQLTKVLAIELAPMSIRVNSVAPTFIRTELTRATLERPEVAERLLSRLPIGRFGEPEEVVGAVVYLAGPMASLVTGHTLLVDGGWTAW